MKRKFFLLLLLLFIPIIMFGCYYSATIDVANYTDTTIYAEVDNKSAYINAYNDKEFNIQWRWQWTYTVDLYATDGIQSVSKTVTVEDGDYWVWYVYYTYSYYGLEKTSDNNELQFKLEKKE